MTEETLRKGVKILLCGKDVNGTIRAILLGTDGKLKIGT